MADNQEKGQEWEGEFQETAARATPKRWIWCFFFLFLVSCCDLTSAALQFLKAIDSLGHILFVIFSP